MSDQAEKENMKSIVILKSNPLTLQSAEQFLKSRGWAVMSTTVLADAAQLIFENKIDYFLICANHPQKKVKNFPRLFKQFPDLHFITYLDIVNTPNMAILQEMGIPYQVLPPVSGTAIERTVFRIEKELVQTKNAAKANSKKNSLHDPQNSSIRKTVQDNLKKYLNNEDDEVIPSLDEDPSGIESLTKNAESFKDYENRIKQQTTSQFEDPNDSASSNDHDNKTTPLTPIKTSSGLFSPEFKEKLGSVLDTSVKSTDSSLPTEKLEQAEHCICFNIETSHFSGFLVAAMGRNRQFDQELLTSVQTKLMDVLQQEGHSLSEASPMDIKVHPVDFENWAIEKAEFLKKSIHDGNEVAMAFFPVEKVNPLLGNSEALDMMSISIEDLTNDIPVTFDVYIHLPANNKYTLYTPKNRIFLSSQKERLKNKGIDKMHTKKDFLMDIKKYHAENTLNKSIQEFANSQAKIKSKA